MRQGRNLELLVKEIEKLNIPNAVVSSPEYVYDIDTGTRREVDIGIRLSKEATEIFIAIECRDRKGVEDIIWIEQLISKKRSICADVLVAVTSSTFTEPARVKARKNGILIRRLNYLEAQDIANLLDETFVEVHLIKPECKSVYFLPEQAISLTHPLQNYKYFCEEVSKIIDLASVVRYLADANLFLKFREKIPHNNDKVEFEVSGKINNNIFILTPNKTKLLEAKMHCVATKVINKLPLSMVGRYEDFADNIKLNEVLEYNVGELYGSTLIINSQSYEAKWHIDFNHLIPENYIFDNIVLKSIDKVSIRQISFKNK